MTKELKESYKQFVSLILEDKDDEVIESYTETLLHITEEFIMNAINKGELLTPDTATIKAAEFIWKKENPNSKFDEPPSMVYEFWEKAFAK